MKFKKIQHLIVLPFLLMGIHIGLFAQTLNSGYVDGALYIKFKKEGLNTQTLKHAGKKLAINHLPLQLKWVERYAVRAEASGLALSFSDKLDGVYCVKIDKIEDIDLFIEELNKDSKVEYVEKVPLRRTFGLVNDPYYGMVENLNLKWHLDLIHAEDAWAKQKGSPNIKVAIVDNAVWGEHEDLGIFPQNQYNVNKDTLYSAPPLDVEQNLACMSEQLYDNTCLAYNWSHGTHCAGLVGAKNNNEKGIASLAGGVTLMGVSCGIEDGLSLEKTTEGMQWAMENGAKIISCSFGGYESAKTEQALISAAVEKGIIILSSAGNENVSTPSYPASYRGVISVGSCDFDKKRSEFSNYGSLVDILAPGGMGPQEGTEIFSTTFSPNQWFRLAGLERFSGQYYENMIGTSMACPIAASLCALMLSKDSSLNHYDIRQILMSTAQISLHSSIVENSGVIDAAAAMEALETYIKPSMPIYLKALSADVEKGNLAAQISWTVNEQNAKPDFFRLYRDNVLLVDNISVNQLKFQDSSARSNFSHCYELCEVLNGKETYKLEAIYHAPVRFRVFLMAVPEEGGVVSGSGIYDFGDYATLVAKPNPGYQFLYWRLNGGVFNERDSIAVRVGANANLQAIFVKSTKLEEANMVEQNLAVYPNPNSGRISIDLRNNEIPKQLKIYDLSGRKVLQLNKQEINSISIESLKSGIYLLRVETENNVYTNKIIKK